MSYSQRLKQHWPVLMIIAIPLFGISASLIAVSQAVTQPPQMVSGEYQRLGKALVDGFGAEQQAAKMGLQAHLLWRGETLHLQLQPRQSMPLPPRLRLNLAHPADASQDLELWLERTQGADYQARAVKPAFQAALRLEPEQQDWRLHGRLDTRAGAQLDAGVVVD